MADYGTCNEYSKLHTVMMCFPINFEIKNPINIIQLKWDKLGIGPDPIKKIQQYNSFRDALVKEGVVVWEIPPSKNLTHQVFTRDVGVITKEGISVANFRFPVRKGEEKEAVKELNRKSVATFHFFENPIIFEGGDWVFLDHENVLLGIGDRTNLHALAKLRSLLPSFNFHPVKLPKDFIHLDVVLNIISPDTALVYIPALFNEVLLFLEELGFKIIEVSPEEQETLATNVLAIGDNKVISASCNKKTNKKLRKNGFKVIEINMSEILKGGGGPRCSTLPVFRE